MLLATFCLCLQLLTPRLSYYGVIKLIQVQCKLGIILILKSFMIFPRFRPFAPFSPFSYFRLKIAFEIILANFKS